MSKLLNFTPKNSANSAGTLVPGFHVQRAMGLLNCRMNIDMPSYGVVMSLLVLA